MGTEELKAALDEVTRASGWSHVERLTTAAAIVSEALSLEGLEATLVGGGAIEFHAPGSYTTSDIDLVVERRTPLADLEPVLERAFRALGFTKAGRHWARDDIFVEVPDTRVVDPVSVYAVGPWQLRVLRKEILLGERIVGFMHWGVTAYGAQALDMMTAFGGELDESILRQYLLREGALEAWMALNRLAASGESVTDAVLQRTLEALQQGTSEDN